MAGESSYRKLAFGKQIVLKAILVLSIASRVCPLCRDDSQCPGDQVCIIDTTLEQQQSNYSSDHQTSDNSHFKDSVRQVIAIGNCGCQSDFILWKWRCFRLAPNLGDPCVVSLQCKEGQFCNPLTKRCSCPLGIQPGAQGQCHQTMTASLPGGSVPFPNPEEDHHKKILAGLLANMNKTLHATLNQTSHQIRGHRGLEDGWTHEQIQTVIYIALAFFIVLCVAVISSLYMRSLSEKRRSAAAIKSLLDLMAENRSLQSVYTMDGLCATSVQSMAARPTPQIPEDLPAPLWADYPPVQSSFESRIHLEPLEDSNPHLPSPHLSAPVLPPISKRPRPVATKVEGPPSPTSLAAISNNLNNLRAQREALKVASAASFPASADLDPIHLELPKDDDASTFEAASD